MKTVIFYSFLLSSSLFASPKILICKTLTGSKYKVSFESKLIKARYSSGEKRSFFPESFGVARLNTIISEIRIESIPKDFYLEVKFKNYQKEGRGFIFDKYLEVVKEEVACRYY